MSRFDSVLERESYEAVLENLGVLSRLTDNKRVTVRNRVINIDTDSKFQFAFRLWHKDQRGSCLQFVRDVVSVAVKMARTSLHDMLCLASVADRHSVQEYKTASRRFGRLTQALEGASRGIETQKVTYRTDERFCAKVDVLVGNIGDWLQEMQDALTVDEDYAAPPLPPPQQVTNDAAPFMDDYEE